MIEARRLPGLPPYGPLPIWFPPGSIGREGLVVEFRGDFETWVGSFQRNGYREVELVSPHPDGRRVVVVASGSLWVVNAEVRTAELLSWAVKGILDVENPRGWIFSISDLAFMRFHEGGLLWRTKRLSWDGFDRLRLKNGELTGLSYSPIDDTWRPFSVDVATGRSSGGSFGEDDAEDWEVLR